MNGMDGVKTYQGQASEIDSRSDAEVERTARDYKRRLHNFMDWA